MKSSHCLQIEVVLALPTSIPISGKCSVWSMHFTGNKATRWLSNNVTEKLKEAEILNEILLMLTVVFCVTVGFVVVCNDIVLVSMWILSLPLWKTCRHIAVASGSFQWVAYISFSTMWYSMCMNQPCKPRTTPTTMTVMIKYSANSDTMNPLHAPAVSGPKNGSYWPATAIRCTDKEGGDIQFILSYEPASVWWCQ